MSANTPNQRPKSGVSIGVGGQLMRFVKPVGLDYPRHPLRSHREELAALQDETARRPDTGQPTRGPERSPQNGVL